MKTDLRLILVLLTLLYSTNGLAIYKCVEKGRTTYSGTPCSTAVSPEKQTVTISAPSVPDPVNAMRLERETRQFVIAEQRRKNAEDAIAAGRVITSMTRAEVRRAIGLPQSINENGRQEQWVYKTEVGRQYVYFVNGLTE
ncbi:MAG: DUF4124 domain-containing protein [Proteobacteria bacterium]|nr:DUF4124 domain-containing protein [Pseudomonadota bacterium]